MQELLKKMYDGRFHESKCACFEECKSDDYDKDCSFICNKSAKIGKNYPKESIKILFVGKEDVSRLEETCETGSFADTKNQHYRGTKFVLAALLGYCEVSDITNKEKFVVGEESLHERFALTNHYHCAFKTRNQQGKRHGIKSTNIMWYHCAEIVRQEIKILCPDVVVIQAGWSAREKTPVQSRLNDIKNYFDVGWSVSEDDEVFGLYIADHVSGKRCYIIGSYHPSFHRWNHESYLEPLKRRVKKVREIIALR